MSLLLKNKKSIVICGPSGVGKGTIITKILSKYNSKFLLSVSHTTRSPRPQEIDGVHYYFVQKNFFEEKIKQNNYFLEFAEVHGNLYGTSFQALEKINNEGKIGILDVDVKGVKQIKNALSTLKDQSFQMKYIFISPPSLTALESRLRGRGTDKEESIQIRLKNAPEELAYGFEGIQPTHFQPPLTSTSHSTFSYQQSQHFDAIVENDQVDTTTEKIIQLVYSWFPEEF